MNAFHPVEPTAMFIHAAIHRIAGKVCVMHTHMPHATALTLTDLRGLDTTLSQNAMRFHGRVAVDAQYNGLALDGREGERIARAMGGADVTFLGNHGVIVCGERVDHAYDDLYYLERACMHEVLARSTGLPMRPADPALAYCPETRCTPERLDNIRDSLGLENSTTCFVLAAGNYTSEPAHMAGAVAQRAAEGGRRRAHGAAS